jgi:peptide/nickel transport system substrate-binding protein
MNQIWRESSIPDLNAGAYVNPRVEQLFDQGVKEFDPDKRKQIYGEIQQILSADAPYIFTTYSMSYQPINKRIAGIQVTKLGLNDSDEWYVSN